MAAEMVARSWLLLPPNKWWHWAPGLAWLWGLFWGERGDEEGNFAVLDSEIYGS
jgi:hypothetical protein